jgi:predicted nucleotidyltransferase
MDQLLASYGEAREQAVAPKHARRVKSDLWAVLLRLQRMLEGQEPLSDEHRRELVPQPPSREEISASQALRRRCVQLLEKKLQEEIPSIELQLFGSTATGLCLPHSDIDVNVSLLGPTTPAGLLALVQRVIERGFSTTGTLCELKSARVPLLKVQKAFFSELNVTFDLDMTALPQDDELRLHHDQVTQWTFTQIRAHKAFEFERVSLVVKAWARQAGLDCTYQGTLPSLAFVVMLSSTAECLRQRMEKTLNADEWSFWKELLDVVDNHPEEQSSVLPAVLLLAFCLRFRDWQTRQVIRTSDSVGENSERHILHLQTSWPDPDHSGFGKTCFVQDPFLLNVNLARFVTRATRPCLVRAFRRLYLQWTTIP